MKINASGLSGPHINGYKVDAQKLPLEGSAAFCMLQEIQVALYFSLTSTSKIALHIQRGTKLKVTSFVIKCLMHQIREA